MVDMQAERSGVCGLRGCGRQLRNRTLPTWNFGDRTGSAGIVHLQIVGRLLL